MVREIFISYSRKDLEKVKAIKAEIEKTTGAECWMDLDGIESGNPNFVKAIVNGIIECKVFLFMLSASSQASKYALGEADVAQDQGKNIIFVNIDSCSLTPEFLLVYGRSNMRRWSVKAEQDLLLRDLLYLMGNKGIKQRSGANTKHEIIEEVRHNTDEKLCKVEEQIERKASLQAPKSSYVNSLVSAATCMAISSVLGKVLQKSSDGSKQKSEGDVKQMDKDDEEVQQRRLMELENVKFERISNNWKFGFIDELGHEVIPCQWKTAFNFSEGLAVVQNDNGKYGYINKLGHIVIPCEWKFAESFQEGLAYVLDADEKYGFIDQTGKVVIPCQWEMVYSFCQGFARVKDSQEKWGFIDQTGKLVIPCIWKCVYPFYESLAAVKNFEGKFGFIGQTGNIVIPCQWVDAGPFSEGLAYIQGTNWKYGFIDKTGKVISPCMWNNVYSFIEGFAAVQDTNEKWGFIDKTGAITISCQWASIISDFSHGEAKVLDQKGQCWKIDTTGKVIGETT